MSTSHQITDWRSLYDLDAPTHTTLTWNDIIERFSTHLRTPDKFSAPLFGPYLLRQPPTACVRHRDGQLRTHPHRCDVCVDVITLAVFDADCGAQDDITNCRDRLTSAFLASLWYTSYSYDYDAPKQAWRLILPLAVPVPAEDWKIVRSKLIHDFAIPADPSKSAGLSHSYFVPSCPEDATPLVRVYPGQAYEAPVFRTNRRTDFGFSFEYTPPAEPTGPVDVAMYQDALRQRASRLARQVRGKDKAAWIRKLLAGEPLAEHGSRNVATATTAGVVAYALPAAPLSVLELLFRPSLLAMQAAGSHLTDSEVRRMLESAMRSAAEKQARTEHTLSEVRKALAAVYAAAPKLGKSAGDDTSPVRVQTSDNGDGRTKT